MDRRARVRCGHERHAAVRRHRRGDEQDMLVRDPFQPVARLIEQRMRLDSRGRGRRIRQWHAQEHLRVAQRDPGAARVCGDQRIGDRRPRWRARIRVRRRLRPSGEVGAALRLPSSRLRRCSTLAPGSNAMATEATRGDAHDRVPAPEVEPEVPRHGDRRIAARSGRQVDARDARRHSRRTHASHPCSTRRCVDADRRRRWWPSPARRA